MCSQGFDGWWQSAKVVPVVQQYRAAAACQLMTTAVNTITGGCQPIIQ